MAQVKMIDNETNEANANLAVAEAAANTKIAANEALLKKQKRPTVKWNADANEYLLLAIADTFKEKKIQIPWDDIAAKMGPSMKGASVLRHLTTLKKSRQNGALMVPPGPYLNSDLTVANAKHSTNTTAKHSTNTSAKPSTETPAKPNPITPFVQRKAAKGKKRYRDHGSDSDTPDDDDDEDDPLKGDPDEDWSSTPNNRKNKGPAKKVRRLSKSTDISDGIKDEDDQHESDGNDAARNTPAETGSVKRRLIVKLKCNPSKLRRIAEKTPNPRPLNEYLSGDSTPQRKESREASTVENPSGKEPEVEQEEIEPQEQDVALEPDPSEDLDNNNTHRHQDDPLFSFLHPGDDYESEPDLGDPEWMNDLVDFEGNQDPEFWR